MNTAVKGVSFFNDFNEAQPGEYFLFQRVEIDGHSLWALGRAIVDTGGCVTPGTNNPNALETLLTTPYLAVVRHMLRELIGHNVPDDTLLENVVYRKSRKNPAFDPGQPLPRP